ncbi:DDB1- and CUL4-associated factor 4 [Oopsacas minuta]|uniref:DDB1- and CUL4-associated factor 4 n=1 Tax=Oopsacas minuta TaxID=111878 RepID=A0AAV7JUE3_9METZ|nr:DDB1- and CUL4-associated factor 4 [Oopsacas minuta]
MASRNIPGYYFDTEKKRYFKIPPKTDRSLYPNLPAGKRPKQTPSLTENTEFPKSVKPRVNTINLLKSQQQGVISGIEYIRRLEIITWKYSIPKLLSVEKSRTTQFDNLEDLCVSQDGNYLIKKFSDLYSNPMESKFRIYFVTIDEKNKHSLKFDEITQFLFYHTNYTGCDWATVNGSHWALFGFQRDGPFNSNASTLLTYKLTEFVSALPYSDRGIQISSKPYVMKESPWNITTNTSPFTSCGQFGIGGETKQHFYDVEREKQYSCSTNNVTVLCQGFCKHSPLLVSGLRNGKGLIWDLRTFPSSPVAELFGKVKKQLKSPLVWIKPILNDVYILVQKQNGELALWDTRTYNKCVLYNPANTNTRLNMIGYKGYITQSEQVLIAFPSVPYRPVIYDVMSGDVLKDNSVFCEENESIYREGINEDWKYRSRFCYADNWGGARDGIEGVLESTSSGEWKFMSIN